jgi:RNA polymerase sigma-70 factor (ECF subfamily)
VIRRACERGENGGLAELCGAYWYPVYCFLRSKGCPEHAVADLTQSFFATLLDGNDPLGTTATQLTKYVPAGRRFRSWIRTRARWHFCNWLDHERVDAAGHRNQRVDVDAADAAWQREAALDYSPQGKSPERVFLCCWAQVVVRRARASLLARYAERPEHSTVAYLLEHLSDGEVASDARSQLRGQRSEEAFRTSLCRLRSEVREQFRECLRLEVARTLPPGTSVDHEIRLLIDALSD